jgi:hypothetical protein
VRKHPESQVLPRSLLGRANPRDEGKMRTTKTYFDRGREAGKLEGYRKALQLFLEGKSGVLTSSVRQRLEQFTLDQLESLASQAVRASSLQELGLEE